MLQTWVTTSGRVRRRDGQVSATGATESGELVMVMDAARFQLDGAVRGVYER